MASTAASTKCDECDKDNAALCPGCNSSRYCSKACKEKAWTTHRLLCDTFKDFQDRPTAGNEREKYVRAIYFHPDEIKPRFVWLKTALKGDKEEQRLQAVPGALMCNSAEEAASREYDAYREVRIYSDLARNRELSPSLFVMYDDKALTRPGCKQNMAAYAIMSVIALFWPDWKNPLIVYSKKKASGSDVDDMISETVGVDVTPAALRHVEHFMNSFGYSGADFDKQMMLKNMGA